MKCTFQRGNQIGARFPGSSIRSRPRAVFVNLVVAKAGEEPLSDLRAEKRCFSFSEKRWHREQLPSSFYDDGSFFYAQKRRK
ncbi:hypothetical protein BS1321_20140 [Peribacillus simplex NBRC 15720 = DSM 1321]|uniref:Uncharacterized protein n=1 Tax=Peribacillus simplex NBRC 15720 = DSM 1321 TaxID=1349754 RepID=A0A223ELB2_9BACI|nr:hypothetical protein BS1321_20140 [Peribacillus simplex NBRC 15720 = DSM 1321]